MSQVFFLGNHGNKVPVDKEVKNSLHKRTFVAILKALAET